MKRHTQPVVTTLRLLAVGCAAISLAGCFQLARPTPPLEQFVLGGAPPTTAAVVTRDAAGFTLGLRRLDLAPYLATTAIIVRRGSQVSSSGFRRWAEEPAAGISRAIAGYLGASPKVLAVDIAPWPVAAPHDYLVQVHIAHLEGVTGDDTLATQGEVHTKASWEIIRTLDAALVARGRTDRREGGWAVGDYRGLVSRLELGLSALAGDVTTCLARIGPVVPLEATKVLECGR
jgi:uncharacterized lipoprotein YmbA